jgi:uncharacterized protein (TIRG00374 family)
MNRKRWLRITLTLLLLAVLLSCFDMRTLGESIASANLVLIAIGIGVKVFGVFLKSRRWALAIEAAQGVRVRHRLFSATVIGLAGNVVMPARLGDVVRLTILSRHNQIPVGFSLSGAGVAYLCDIILVGICFLVCLCYSSVNELFGKHSQGIAIGAVLLGLIAFGLLYAVWRRGNPSNRWLDYLPTRVRHFIRTHLHGSLSGFSVFEQPGRLARLISYTILILLAEVVAMWVSTVAFGFQLPLVAIVTLVTALQMSYALPLSPGNLGTHQLVSIMILGAFALPASQAMALSITVQISFQLTLVAMAAIILQQEGMLIQSLRSPRSERSPQV